MRQLLHMRLHDGTWRVNFLCSEEA